MDTETSSGTIVGMGYFVKLVKSEIVIQATHHVDALAAVQCLDSRDELKAGWRDGRGGQEVHWAYASSSSLQEARSLVDALRVFRFESVLEPDGELHGVRFVGQNAGHELHVWAALAPFVEPGGEMIWLGEDDVRARWSFNGLDLLVAEGRMVSD